MTFTQNAKTSASLGEWIANGIANGWRLEHRTDDMAVMVRGRRPNHLLHLILSLVTLGLWLPVWVLVGVFGGEKRKVLSVNRSGHVSAT